VKTGNDLVNRLRERDRQQGQDPYYRDKAAARDFGDGRDRTRFPECGTALMAHPMSRPRRIPLARRIAYARARAVAWVWKGRRAWLVSEVDPPAPDDLGFSPGDVIAEVNGQALILDDYRQAIREAESRR